MSRIVDHLSDMVTAINAGSYTYSESFTAVRKFVYDVSTDKSQKLTVVVYPRFRSAESSNRNSTVESNTIEVVVRRPRPTDDQVEELLTLVDDICDLLMRSSLSAKGAKVLNYSQESFYDDFSLHEANLFVSTISFEIWDQF